MRYIWIRRGYGCFVRCKNEVKARRKAAYWKLRGQGDGGTCHPVIGLFTGRSPMPSQAEREVLFPRIIGGA